MRKKKTPEQLREEAQRLLAEAAEMEGDAPVTLLDDPGPVRVEETSAAVRVDQDAPPARIGDELPDDDVEAVRDPLETYDMSAELPELRQMLLERNYELAQSTGNGEVWLQRGTKFRATLLSDPNRRLRLEIRNPDGSMRTEINPAWPVDVRPALP
jgi:hypothetical protein